MHVYMYILYMCIYIHIFEAWRTVCLHTFHNIAFRQILPGRVYSSPGQSAPRTRAAISSYHRKGWKMLLSLSLFLSFYPQSLLRTITTIIIVDDTSVSQHLLFSSSSPVVLAHYFHRSLDRWISIFSPFTATSRQQRRSRDIAARYLILSYLISSCPSVHSLGFEKRERGGRKKGRGEEGKREKEREGKEKRKEERRGRGEKEKLTIAKFHPEEEMHGRSPVDHDRQVLDATVYRCVGGRVWETLALGYASSYSTPPVESNVERGMWRAGERKEKSVFSPRERNERSVRPEVRDDTGCCQWAFAHGYHSPSNLRPPNSPPLSTHAPHFSDTPASCKLDNLRASSSTSLSLSLSLSLPLSRSLSVLLRDGGGETWRVEMGKTCFPIHRSGQEGRKSAGGIRRLPQTQD